MSHADFSVGLKIENNGSINVSCLSWDYIVFFIVHFAVTMENECGPIVGSLLTMQDDHISTAIWAGGVRDKLDVRQYTANHQQWILSDPQRELLSQWGFSAFTNNRSVPQNDIHLITALVERY